MVLPASVIAAVYINGINYELSGNTATVVAKPSKYSGAIKIPATITYDGKKYQVTSIQEYAFENCTGLTSIVIANSVTDIGQYAFDGCSNMTAATLGTGLTCLPEGLFSHCSKLASVNIPNSVESIERSAFFNCKALTSIVIPGSVTSIDSDVFSRCSGLASISVASDNTVYDSRNNCNAIIEKSTNTMVLGCKNTVFPDDVTSIGNYAFRGCYDLTSVTLPHSVTTIGDAAFAGCSSLTSIDIPNSVTSIGDTAFGTCSSLTSIDIPSSVTSIAFNTFVGCTGLTSVNIPGSVTTIGSNAFSRCSSLTAITIPYSVTTIGSSAFNECTSLTAITIPYSVTQIGYGAFSGCPNLTFVTNENPTPISIFSDVFSNHANATLYVPYGSKSAYEAAPWWKDFKEIIETDITLPQTLALDSIPAHTYGDAAIMLPASTSQELTITWTSSDTNVATISGNTLTITGAGTATITAEQEGSSCYLPFTKDFMLTVAKAPLTITAKNCSIVQGDALPVDYEAEYDGFVNGETAGVLTSHPTFSCSATSSDTPGSYAITPSGAAADNYDISYVDGTLTIMPVTLTITIPASGMTTYCSAYDLDFSAVTAFKAYIIVGYNNKTNQLVAVQVDEAPAGTGLYLKGKAGSYGAPYKASGANWMDMLAGVTEATTINATEGRFTNLLPYNLAGTTIFVAANDGSSMAANTAYLQVETAKYNGQPAEIVLVSKELLGDVNKDGDISVSDINTLVNIIMGKGFGNAK